MEGVRSVINGDGRASLRALALVAALVLALGAAACGDDEADGGDSSNAAQSSAETTTTAVDNSPEGQVRASYARFVEVFYSKDPAAVCEQLTPKARERIGRRYKGCEARLRLFFSKAQMIKDKPYVVKLRVDGPRALALVKTKKSDTYPVPFLKQDGEWKVNGGWNGS